MTSLDIIRNRIRRLYETDPNIHINVALTSPKLNLKNDPVVIKGVYPHIFRIEERSSGVPRCHALQYSDVLMHHIEIIELEDQPLPNAGEY